MSLRSVIAANRICSTRKHVLPEPSIPLVALLPSISILIHMPGCPTASSSLLPRLDPRHRAHALVLEPCDKHIPWARKAKPSAPS